MTESETSLAHSGATSGDKGFGPGERVGVRLTLPLPTGRSGVYDYRVGPGQYLQRGQLVRVPLGPRVVSGVIWGAGEGRVADDKLRDVAETIALAPLSIALLDFTDWLARYTLSPPGPVLRMVLSVPEALDPPKAEVRYRPALWPDGLKHTPARDRVWDAFGKADAALTAPEIARAAEVSTGVVAGLRDAGALQRLDIVEEATFPEPDPARSGPTLSDEQATAAEALTAAVGQG
ncbi:MAG: primosomal protein N', partial [Rhodospirillales bacterium]